MRILSSRPSDIKMLEELKLVTSLLSKLAPFGKLYTNQLYRRIFKLFEKFNVIR
jgi:hypothetical protein